MLILTWLGIIFVLMLYLAITWCKLSPNIMLPRVKMSIKHDMGELFLKLIPLTPYVSS
jgi:hypothetical protein